MDMGGDQNASALGPPPSESESSDDRLRRGLIWLSALIAVLIIVLIIVLLTSDDGTDLAADTTSTQAPSTSEPATTSSTADVTTTTQAATPTAAPTTAAPTTAAPTTAAPTTTPVVSLPSFVIADCIGYDPAALEVEDLGAVGWRLNAGSSALLLYDNETDALRGLAIAGNHAELCFIGRSNTQVDRFLFIHEFWHGDSGVTVPIPGPEDCLPYDPSGLSIEDTGGNVWGLRSGVASMAVYDGELDALAGLTLAENFSEQCFIGRDNTRPDRISYLREYWT